MIEILIVDDEKNVVSQWRQALRPLGHQIVACLSTTDALEQCNEHDFDLVIVDFIMPEMTGVELVNKIRKKLPHIKSILISGKLDKNMSDEKVKEVIKDKVEVDLYLKKPVRNDALIAAVTEVLAGDEDGWADWALKNQKARNTKDEKAKDASEALKKHLRKKK